MNIFEIEEAITSTELSLEELNDKRREEVYSILSNFKPGDTIESHGDYGNVKHFEIVKVTKSRVVYNMFMIYGNTVSKKRCSPDVFFTMLNDFTNFTKKLERDYKLKKLGV